MIKILVRIIVTIVGMSIGYGFSSLIFFLLGTPRLENIIQINPIIEIAISVLSILFFGLIFYLFPRNLKN
ncbi:MAG: hypothetical protein WC996_02650 [Peptostreptococcales bacterium]